MNLLQSDTVRGEACVLIEHTTTIDTHHGSIVSSITSVSLYPSPASSCGFRCGEHSFYLCFGRSCFPARRYRRYENRLFANFLDQTGPYSKVDSTSDVLGTIALSSAAFGLLKHKFGGLDIKRVYFGTPTQLYLLFHMMHVLNWHVTNRQLAERLLPSH